jgi:tRNA 5-methylaminomethyl-2-thiouridine biosynthesis bifunctional protein
MIFKSSDMTPVSPIRWDAKGVPHSIEFRDKYFCTQNGYEEYRHILIYGSDFPQRFAQLDPTQKGTFRIIETGFGTGMSFCCLWQLWEQYAPASWTLHFISIELYPLSQIDLDRALSVWLPLAKYRQLLASQYQPSSQGIRDFDFPENRAHLTIVFADVVDALAIILKQGIAAPQTDGWLLNGFSPFANPRMWVSDVFAGMARLSQMGTTFSTFTVAGVVRRGLETAGFTVKKFAGYGTKKEMLRGTFQSARRAVDIRA